LRRPRGGRGGKELKNYSVGRTILTMASDEEEVLGCGNGGKGGK